MHRLTARRALVLVAAGLLLVGVPSSAAADFLLEPFLAWSRSAPVADASTATATWHAGGGVGGMWTRGRLLAGAEFGYAAGFFDPTPPASDLLQTSQLLTVSGMVGITRDFSDRSHRLLPYATGGAGVIRQVAKDRLGLIDVTRNDPGINVGGGARFLFTRYIGVGADLRYFADLRKPFAQPSDLTAGIGRLTFWRASATVVLRFGD